MGYETEKMEVPEDFTDLGEDMTKMHGMHAVDASAAAEKNHDTPKVYYPELHFEGEHAQHLAKHLKDHGTAVIHYKKVSESTHHDTRHGKSETRHKVGIQIHGIRAEEAKGDKMTRETEKEPLSDSDAIDKGLEAASENA